MNRPGGPDPAYVRARRALLDALDALGPHRRAVILVGAQAIYLHVDPAGEALSSFTIDADLALDPAALADEPALQTALLAAGLSRREQPGLWFTADGVEVDFLVPSSIAGRGRRGADLGPHHDRTAVMRAAGLEAALIDNARQLVTALEPRDRRSYTIRIAGPAALLIAKLHKIGERAELTPARLKNKDAYDLFRLLRSTQTDALAGTLAQLQAERLATETTAVALRFLQQLFTSASGPGITLLRAAVAGVEDEDTAAQSCIALAQDLLDAMA